MEKRNRQHSLFRIILSLVFILFGIIALGNNIGWWYIDDILMLWWPLIIILLGFITLFAPGGSWGGGLFMVLLGVVLLLHTHGIYDIGQLIWPAMLILAGFLVWPRKKIVRENSSGEDPGNAEEVQTDEHVFNINAVLRGQTKIISDKSLNGGHATAVFGHLYLDLRNAVPGAGAFIEISAVFGKVTVVLPPNWNINKEGGAVLGKINDKRSTTPDTALSYSVTMDMNTVFGEIELTNV
jgi:predicted membrane protein